MIDVEQLQTKLISFDDTYARFTRTEFYIRADIVNILCQKFQKVNGGMALWLQENRRLRARDLSIRLLTQVDLERFERQDRYPVWAVQQLLDMTPVGELKHKRQNMH